MKRTTLIGIDAGQHQTGIITITQDGIREGQNLPNEEVFDFVLSELKKCDKMHVVLEDVRPYNMRISDGIINTIKFIGELEYRLRTANVKFDLIPRWQVKQWVFVQYRIMAEEEIVKNMQRSRNLKIKKKEKVSETIRKPTFVWVDDRIVQKAMKLHWEIEKPKVGRKTSFNLKDHSWQALGVASVYIASHNLLWLVRKATL